MDLKNIEIRDRATCIDVIVSHFTPEDALRNPGLQKMLWKHGYSGNPERWKEFLFVTRLDDGRCCTDPFAWGTGARTMLNAHQIIIRDWDALQSGDVVDVEYSLGEKPQKKIAEWRTT